MGSGINGGSQHGHGGGHGSHHGGGHMMVLMGLWAFCSGFPGVSRALLLFIICWLLK